MTLAPQVNVPDDVKVRAAALLKAVEAPLVTSVMVIQGHPGASRVIHGDGIGVTILRAFVTAFLIFSNLKRPQPCVVGLASALTWVCSLDESEVGGLSAEQIRKHFKQADLGHAARTKVA